MVQMHHGRSQRQHTFVWKQKTVTQMQTTAVMAMARNTTLVS